MPNSFDFRNPPFDRLAPTELDTLRKSLDIGYYRPGEAIIAQGASTEFLFVVIKGLVEERDNDLVVAHLGPKDSFDTNALVQGQSRHGFVTTEETLCYLIPRHVAQKLIQANPRFGAFFYLELSHKLDAMAQEEEASTVGSLMRGRISDIAYSPAIYIDADDTIETAGRTMSEAHTNALFVRDGERIGIITGMNLSKAMVLQRLPLTAPVRSQVHFNILTAAPDDFIYSALIQMTKANKRRIAIHDGTQYIGILEDLHLLGFLSGNAQVVAARIDRASSVEDLKSAAKEIEEQVRLLRRQGVRVDAIAEIVSDLNRRLFNKVFRLIAPASIREQGCLIVMGSEGRGEQTVRTDQDNALILAEPVPDADLDAFRRNFTAALESFGFAPCPGNVMVRNPEWSRTVDEYTHAFGQWVAVPGEHAHMDIAIFYDAVAVAGREELLDQAKAAMIEAVRGRSAFMVHFARAIDSFPAAIGLFNTLRTTAGEGDAVDLKKGGIFPIVHGVRSLALERGLTETGTAARIQRLAATNLISEDMGRELTQSLYLLMTLRLDAYLSASGSLVRPAEMSTMERDVLRDALRVVKQFQEIVRHHFNLGKF